MRRALALAERGLGLAPPNPLVGCVLVRDGAVVGEGWHRGRGTDHAEALALAEAGERSRGATAFVTLEPCSHEGRTPPCAPALIEAGVARVVAAIGDPYREVDGRGFRMLRDAGLAVEVGLLAEEAERQNAGFLKHVRSGRPFVTLKLASSLDGKVAARDGSSRWITGPAARADVHRLRAAAGAVAVGAGTAVADDPALTVRLDGYQGRQPLRVVVDASGRVPPGGVLFDDAAPTLVATSEGAAAAAVQAWRAAGADVAVLPRSNGGVSLAALMELLGDRDIQHVVVEGGPTLAWSAVGEGVVDRFVLFLAPKLIGGTDAPGALGGQGIATLGSAVPLVVESVEAVGDDLKITARSDRGG